ncbi:kinesin light chain [Colletotrichum salicis]|uniref:Kinesin light chain n=1 Tax=Colletotrichum salicis TaxID=1209931 RepID=A0A135UUJ5_9PEZI|nr:kinesin light chain [Colletotrichum salicis]
MAQGRSHNDYTVAWICPLEVEQIAAMTMLDEKHDALPQTLADHNVYNLGSINGHNVVIAGLHQPGNNSAATVVTQMRMTFPNLRFGLLVGIGGGVPVKTDNGMIRLGHVVVSKPAGGHSGALQYDHGKAREGYFERTGALAPPPAVLLNAAQALAVQRAISDIDPVQQNVGRIDTTRRGLQRFQCPGEQNDHHYPSHYVHQHEGEPCATVCDPLKRVTRPGDDDDKFVIVHRGNIASGELVVKDAVLRDRLAQQLGLLCFEMEAAGAIADFPCLVVRGISDYCDSHKNNIWHGYAAAVAAAYARQLFFHLPVDVMQRQEMSQSASAEPGSDGSMSRQTPPLSARKLPAHAPYQPAPERGMQMPGQRVRNGDSASAQGAAQDMTFSIPRKPVNKPEKRVLIAVFGMTGTGKTSLIKTLAGEAASQLRIGHGLESCTQDIETVDFSLDGHKVTLVDTPGFDDSERSDTEILRLIAAWLQNSFKNELLLSGLIYLHRISDVRMSGSSRKNMRMFGKLCGADHMSKVCLVTTMWDKVTPQDGLSKENDLKRSDYWGPMIDSGCSVKRQDRGLESARDVIRGMLNEKPTAVKLQEEMMVAGKNLVETDAGMAVDEEIRKLEKKHEEDLEELRLQMREANEQRNMKLQAQLQEEYAQTISKLQKRAKEREELNNAHIVDLQRRHQNASHENERQQDELRFTAARERERANMAEKLLEQARSFPERPERFREAPTGREPQASQRIEGVRQRFANLAEEDDYEQRPRRREAGGGRDLPNTVMARRNSAPLQSYGGTTVAETKTHREKYHGQEYKTFPCYVPRTFGSSGCGRPFDVVNPVAGKIQCCYCRKSWTIWGAGNRRIRH